MMISFTSGKSPWRWWKCRDLKCKHKISHWLHRFSVYFPFEPWFVTQNKQGMMTYWASNTIANSKRIYNYNINLNCLHFFFLISRRCVFFSVYLWSLPDISLSENACELWEKESTTWRKYTVCTTHWDFDCANALRLKNVNKEKNWQTIEKEILKRAK